MKQRKAKKNILRSHKCSMKFLVKFISYRSYSSIFSCCFALCYFHHRNYCHHTSSTLFVFFLHNLHKHTNNKEIIHIHACILHISSPSSYLAFSLSLSLSHHSISPPLSSSPLPVISPPHNVPVSPP